ncbi:MAG: alpha/beta fold hydrolase [Actinomycetota bacterium]
MSRFLLVHGAWHGAWCWAAVAAQLRARGHSVTAPDLAGHGSDRTPIGRIGLSTYVDRVCAELSVSFQPAILVGHSLGGMVISQVAEEIPDRVDKLVYLSAYLPGNGESLLDWARRDRASIAVAKAFRSRDRLSLHLPAGLTREALYNDCSEELASWAAQQILPEPAGPFSEPVSTTTGRFGSVPRIYVQCTLDRTVSPALQERMVAAQPCTRILLESGHCPFVSMPEQLAQALSSQAT